MDFFRFEQASSANAPHPTYDLAALSPGTPEPDTMFTNHHNSPPMHIDPGNVWNHPLQTPSADAGLGKFLNSYSGSVDQIYGQVTPPEESDMLNKSLPGAKRADSGVEVAADSSASPRNSSASKTKPSMRSSAKSRRDSRLSDDDVIGDVKKEKYREKNRVAAAKCRAKKKEHVDGLEDNHRTQSALNIALKQTEKTLRDELSFWRTQALQHTFCNCRSIQDYNMQKAQNMAVGHSFAAHGPASPPALNSDRSSSAVSYHGLQSKSRSGPEAVSPMLSDGENLNSFAAINGGAYSGSDVGGPEASFSIMPDLDLKGFPRELPEQ